jgi:hypothetical protein
VADSGYRATTHREQGSTDSLPDINDRIVISRSGMVKTYVLVIVIAMCKLYTCPVVDHSN